MLVTAMVGNNLPDADLVVSHGDAGLGYVLQHRGYTHTLVGCLVLAMLLYGAVALAWRLGRVPATKRDHALLAFTALLSLALHLGMDALNSYGVHPFWPFDDRWIYGDTLFIVEPLLWIAAAPLVLLQRTLAARIALGAVVGVALIANVVLHPGQFAWWIALAIIAIALVLLGREPRGRLAAAVSVALLVGVVGTFAGAGRVAASQVQRAAAQQFPGETMVDDILSPGPMQPGCWDVLLLQRDGERYLARQGLTVTSGDVDRARCSRLQSTLAGKAPWRSIEAGEDGDRRTRWDAGLSVDLPALEAHIRGDCRAEALMQFVRAPYLAPVGGRVVLGDLRFDRGIGPGFAELVLPDRAAPCPRPVPWVPPRQQWLTGRPH